MYLAFHIIILILLVLANGGRYDWAYNIFGIILCAYIIPISIELFKSKARIHQQGPFFWIILIASPWFIFTALFTYALFNPSYETVFNNLFSPLIPLDHISYLPTTPNTIRSQLFLQFSVGLLVMSYSLIVLPLTKKGIRLNLKIIFVFGTILAVFGTAMKLSGTGSFLWYFEFREPVEFATFFYKNHWAYFALLCASIGIALFNYTYNRERHSGHLAEKSISYALCTILILVTIPLSNARAASLAAIPLAFLLIYLIIKTILYRKSKFVLMTTFVLCTIFGGMFLYSIATPQLEKAISRSEQQIENYKLSKMGSLKRIALYQDAWKMIKERPIWGWGIGSFIHIHPIYADQLFYQEGAAKPVAYEFCHCEYLESLAEVGIFGSLLLILPFFFVFTILGTKAKWNDPFGAILVFGSILVLMTAFVDFTLSNPAIAMMTLLCAMLGLRYSLL